MTNFKLFIKQKKIDVLIILSVVSFIIILPQIYEHAIIISGDSVFHMNRFYETYKQIKTGNFSYFQSLYGFNGSARIVNALYGPYLSYLMGFLLLIVKSWFKFQLITNFLLLVVSGLSMFLLARKVKVRKWIAIVMAIMYMCTPWVGNSSFTAVGASLFPLVFIAGISMFAQTKPISILKLSLLMAVLVQIHMFTSFLAVIVLIPFSIVAVILNKNRAQLVFRVIISAIITMLLTSNVWGAMFEVMANNHILTVFPNEMSGSVMHFSAIQFSLFDYGLYSAIFAFVVVRSFVLWKKIDVIQKMTTLLGVFFLILSTSLFPWRFAEFHFPFLRTLIQFPERFSVVAFVAMILSMGISLESSEILNLKKVKVGVKILFLAFTALLVLNANSIYGSVVSYWNTSKPFGNAAMPLTKNIDKIKNGFKNSDNLGQGFEYLAKVNPDYLPIKQKINNSESYNKLNPYVLYYQEVSLNKVKTKRLITKDGKIEITWKNGGSKKKFIKLPIVKYANSRIYVNNREGTKKVVKSSEIGVVSVNSNVGKNKLTIQYVPEKATRILLLTNLLSWSLFMLVAMFNYVKTKLKNKYVN